MPARGTADTASGKSGAASILTRSAPASLAIRTAARTAAAVPSCTGPNGRSTLTRARDTPRRTAWATTSICSMVTSSGFRWPPRFTPTDASAAVADPGHLEVPGHHADDLVALGLHAVQRRHRHPIGHGPALDPQGRQ